jgi:acetate---CoA ligase (ADP-forming)
MNSAIDPSSSKKLPLDRLLRPRSVAIVGASPATGSLGASVMANLDRAGYLGDLYLVNPKRTEILGRKCLPSVDALPEHVDCVLLSIPRASVPEALRACASRKAGSVIIFSSGFAESGSQGLAEQQEITRIARENNIVILGPNCLGTVNYVDNIALTFIATPAAKLEHGRQGVAVISQSGAMAAVLVVNLSALEVGISFSVSTGNEAASGVEDYVEYMIDDPTTKVITMIVEQFRSPRRFLALVELAIARGKKIVLLHPGSSAAGRNSAATHTGAMAGDYQTMHTKVRHAGVVFVDTLEQLVDVSELMVRLPSMPVGGAAILAESGAFKAMALDFCERIGLELPAFTSGVDAALRAVLPDFISPTNPIDLTAQALVDPGIYRRTLPLMIGDGRCGSLVLAIILTDESTSGLKIPPILEAIRALRDENAGPQKPIIFAGMDEGARILPEYIQELRRLGVTFFPSPERALQALSIVTEWSAEQQRRQISERPSVSLPHIPIRESGVVPEYRSKEILKSAGIPIPRGALARSLEEATKIAHQIGFPVVLKAQSANLSHKSDVGGVVLDLRDAAAVADGWTRLQSSIARKMPKLILDGVLVEQMGAPGVELIVGARNDHDWGPVLLVGLGGVFAEAFKDIRLIPPDLLVEAIITELYKLSGAALLRGFRGAVAPDVRAAAEIVCSLGRLVLSSESILEVDLNPVILYPEGKGAVALDALILMA